MTKQEFTFNALNGSFESTGNILNLTYLITEIGYRIDNIEPIYKKQWNYRIQPHTIVWDAFTYLANEKLKQEYPSSNYTCTSKQLKNYLSYYGYDYKTCFIELIEGIENERLERKAAEKEVE